MNTSGLNQSKKLQRITIHGCVLGLHYVDEHDNPVERTKDTHPYSYDGYVVWRGGKNKEVTGTAYSDRLREWDCEKYDTLSEKYGNPASMNKKNPAEIEKFLQDYNNEPKLKLILIMEYCRNNGYPVWRFDYHIPKLS